MKILNIIFTIVFLLFAALQWNDPDPLIWIPIYLYAAVLTLLAARRKYYPRLYLLGIGIYLIYALYLFFEQNGVLSWATEHDAENLVETMQASKPWIESTREFGGLLFVIIALLINYRAQKKGPV